MLLPFSKASNDATAIKMYSNFTAVPVALPPSFCDCDRYFLKYSKHLPYETCGIYWGDRFHNKHRIGYELMKTIQFKNLSFLHSYCEKPSTSVPIILVSIGRAYSCS